MLGGIGIALLVIGGSAYSSYLDKADEARTFVESIDAYNFESPHRLDDVLKSVSTLGSVGMASEHFEEPPASETLIQQLVALSDQRGRDNTLDSLGGAIDELESDLRETRRTYQTPDVSEYERKSFMVGRRFDTAGPYGYYEAADMSSYQKVILIAKPESLDRNRGSENTLYVEYEGEKPVQMQNAYGRATTTEYFHTYRARYTPDEIREYREKEAQRQEKIGEVELKIKRAQRALENREADYRRRADGVVGNLIALRPGPHRQRPLPTKEGADDTSGPAQPDPLAAGDDGDNERQSLGDLRQGMPYSEAREIILDAGWQATVVPLQAREFAGLRESAMVGRGWHELQSCAGSGLAPCRFEFGDIEGQTLVVITLGESEDPSLNQWRLQ